MSSGMRIPRFRSSSSVPTAVEFMEREVILASEEFLGRRFPDNSADAYLLLTFDAASPAELELALVYTRVLGMRVRVRFRIVPAAESVTVADHLTVRTGPMCDIIRLDKLRCTVCGTLTVLVKDQPVAFRRVNGEDDIALDGHLRPLAIGRGLRRRLGLARFQISSCNNIGLA